jgi:hypothetical protein
VCRGGRTIERRGGCGLPGGQTPDASVIGSWDRVGGEASCWLGTGEDGALAPPAVRGRAPLIHKSQTRQRERVRRCPPSGDARHSSAR